MATGGATWDTAGTLTPGADNTFDVADATENGVLDNLGYWTFTITTPSRVDLSQAASFDDGSFQLYRGDTEAEAEFVFLYDFISGSQTVVYLLGVGTYHLLVGTHDPTTSLTSYQINYARRATAATPWNSTLRDDPTNILELGESTAGTWEDDVIRRGSYRTGDYTIQETLGGPWNSVAGGCAMSHALWGDQNTSLLWDNICPLRVADAADLEILGGSSVSYHYSDNLSPFPGPGDSAHMIVRTTAWGIWLKPVEEHTPPRGVLPFPDPEDYGAPPDAVIEWESSTVELIGLEIADGAGSLGSDPDSVYAVNFDTQPTYAGGTWDAWQKGFLPGSAIDPPAWAGAEDTSLVFDSEGVADVDKTRHPLGVPADGFASLTQDYVNDSYDFGVIAGPAEAFAPVLDFTASRTAAVAFTLFVHVRSPRFRFVYDGPTSIPPRRIRQRSDGATHGAARVRGGGNTAQSGNRTLGNIL